MNAAATISTTGERRELTISKEEWKWPFLFLISFAMCGLQFPIGYLLLLYVMINRFKNDRYDFLIMAMLFFGNYAFVDGSTFVVKTWDIGLIICVVGLCLYRKPPTVKITLWGLAIYGAILIILSRYSEERLSIQLLTIRNYLCFVFFIIPLLVFVNRDFDIHIFFRRLMPFALLCCAFYAFDCYIFNGNVLVPHTYSGESAVPSTFYSLDWEPLSFTFPRKYPPGIYILAITLWPMLKYYKLRPWMWIVILLGLFATRTFTIIATLTIAFLIILGHARKMMPYLLIGAVALTAVYFIDDSMGYDEEKKESTLRIASSINQFVVLANPSDPEDLATMGSGRFAQALPKIDLVYEYDKEWVGLGFLHKEHTKNPRLFVSNPFYSDVTKAEEVATGVEIWPVQVFITIGFIGLIVHYLFFFFTWLVVKREYRRVNTTIGTVDVNLPAYYGSVLLILFGFSISGFANFGAPDGLMLISTVFGTSLLTLKCKK